MALKLGKCRLCLKLGDFFSIFTVDNALQLAEMVMDCTNVKVYEGDGLPDKVCSECVQKLSSAYIFKQQCERSDQELRRNYVPPPGFSVTPPPPNRQSSDSAFSTHTEVSNKPSYTETPTSATRTRKRSRESDNVSVESRSQDSRPSASKRVEELRRSDKKKPKLHSGNSSMGDSDYEDNSMSQYSGDTDSDEPLLKNEVSCKECDRIFPSVKSLASHKRVHTLARKSGAGENSVADIPKVSEDATDAEDKLSCDKCGKTFKLKIMLKRHSDVCGKTQVSPTKELLISLEPIDAQVDPKKIKCEMCSGLFKTMDNLEKHMKVVHAAVLKRTDRPKKVSVPCLHCGEYFDDYYIHCAHFNSCSQKTDITDFECPVCKRVMSKRNSYFTHIKSMHFEPRNSKGVEETKQEFDCRMCNKKLDSQEQLVTHLAAHMSNIDNVSLDETSRTSTPEVTAEPDSPYTNANISSGHLSCSMCDKKFTYRKSLVTHEQKHMNGEIEIKTEPPDKNPSSSLNESYEEQDGDSESSDEGDDNTCDICEKQFSYRRLLLQHKRTKHNMSSGTKRAKINLKDCSVRCLICDIEMKVSAINEHNQKHITANIKPRNLYTCAECGEKVKSCSALANHIKLVHRLKQQPTSKQFEGADLADFCEVVVTKAEPLDGVQSHNDFGEVPVTQQLEGTEIYPCPVCDKKMKTLLSLKRHMNWHTNVGNNMEKKLECFVCKEKFRFQCHYRAHMRVHLTDTNLDPSLLTCSICGRKSKHLRAAQAHMNFHKQTRFQNKDYECSICGRVYQDRKVYLAHMSIHLKKGEGYRNTVVGDIVPNSTDQSKLDGKFTCQLCGKVLETENSLKCHMSYHNSKTMLFGARHDCHICKLKFTNKRRLEVHIRSHYEDDNGPYKCAICGKGYIDEDYYRRHVKGHNFDHQSHKKRIEKLRKDKVKCPICTRFYPDLVKLIRHLRRTHPESKMIKTDPDAPMQTYYSCKLCAKVFLDERRLNKHEEAHLRKPEFFKCKFCGKKTISLKNHNIHIKGHLTKKHLDEPLKCYKCEERFIRGYDLHYHLRDEHKINEDWIAERTEQTLDGPLKELQCSICLKVLASKGNFERHIDYHNTLRCNYCYEFFITTRFLEGHLAFSCDKKKLIGDTEIYPRKLKCHLCYKAFHLQVKLDCHLRTQHSIKVSKEAREGKKDNVCDFCFKVFENEDALTGHKIYHRTVLYYGCLYCNRKFGNLTTFRKHKNHHFAQLNVDEPTKCEHCDETFVAFREMIYHMRDVHNDDKEWLVMPKDSIEETCHICNKTFFNLHKHLSYHEENRCRKCREYFYSHIDYDNHLCPIESDEELNEEIENGLPKYEECVFCFKPINKKNSKRKHDHIHLMSGSISCRFCPLKFKTMDAFNIHAFSHRSRKYNNKPLKCRLCREKFVKYGPFMKHMKSAHKSTKKMHYRAKVLEERCVVCGNMYPNLHNHYRAHLLHQCQQCNKYFTSSRIFDHHQCDKEDADPSKVFSCDENLNALINSYVPKDTNGNEEKYYGYTDDEDDEEEVESIQKPVEIEDKKEPDSGPETIDEVSQDSVDENLHSMVHAPIISDVLSLYQNNDDKNGVVTNIVNLTDDDSLDIDDIQIPIITIDD